MKVPGTANEGLITALRLDFLTFSGILLCFPLTWENPNCFSIPVIE